MFICKGIVSKLTHTQLKAGEIPMQLSPFHDPQDIAASAGHSWGVDGLIDVGKRTPTGGVARSLHVIIETGDFVEVTVTADIVTNSRADESTTSVHLRLEQVVQLASRDDNLVCFHFALESCCLYFQAGSDSENAEIVEEEVVVTRGIEFASDETTAQ